MLPTGPGAPEQQNLHGQQPADQSTEDLSNNKKIIG